MTIKYIKNAATCALTITVISCSSNTLKPIVKPHQKMAFSTNKIGHPEVQMSSSKRNSKVRVVADTDPFMTDKQALFDIVITNNSSRSVFIGEKEIKFFVDDKEIEVFGREEKLAHIKKQKNAGRAAQAGKKILSAFAAGLANTNYASTSYGGYVGNSYHSGTVSSTYINQRGVNADTARSYNQIDNATIERRHYLDKEYERSANYYFQPRSLRSKQSFRFCISPDLQKRKSTVLIKVKVGADLHELKYEFE